MSRSRAEREKDDVSVPVFVSLMDLFHVDIDTWRKTHRHEGLWIRGTCYIGASSWDGQSPEESPFSPKKVVS